MVIVNMKNMYFIYIIFPVTFNGKVEAAAAFSRKGDSEKIF